MGTRAKAAIVDATSPEEVAFRDDVAYACLSYPDLGAHVYLDHVPDELLGELPELYSSLLSTLDWFAVNGQTPDGVCVLDEPRHVIPFRRSGAALFILNAAFACRGADANRICRALFRALPHIRRIQLDASFAPHDLEFPTIVSEGWEAMVIDLPCSIDEYVHSLGKSTRRNLRCRENLLHRTFADVTNEVVKPDTHCRELVECLAAWKIERFHKKGRITYWETKPRYFEQVAGLLERCGEAHVTCLSGRRAAIRICFRVGETQYGYEVACAPEYDEFSLGALTSYWLVRHAIESGAKRLNLMAGSTQLKVSLGARPVRTSRVLVFRSRPAQLRSAGAVLSVIGLRIKSRVGRVKHALRLWGSKHRRLDALAARLTGRGMQ
jgi:CelD/BcsL family acetyltransferase involved in cellulose biosynthesis